MANSVTGAASLFRRELLDYALPFPPGQFAPLPRPLARRSPRSRSATSRSSTAPLYDYVQHGEAVLGHAAANRMTQLGDRFRGWRRAAARPRRGCGGCTYFVDACRLLQFATILRAALRGPDGADEAPRARRASCAPTARCSRSAGWRRARRASSSAGPRRSARSWAAASASPGGARLARPPAPASRRGGCASTRRPPSRLALKPGSHGPEPPTLRVIHEKLAPLELALRDDAPERVNLLIPTIDLDHFFGGYIGKLNLARRLAERGTARADRHRRPRRAAAAVVARERSRPTAGWTASSTVSRSRSGASRRGVEVSRARPLRRDDLVDGAPRRAARSRGRDDERFLYLIQEYEPFTFPMGSLRRWPSESYTLPAPALFSTELLRDWFRAARTRRLRGRRRCGRRRVGGVPERDHRRSASSRRSDLRRARRRAGCCSTRGPRSTRRATCSSSARSRSSRAVERACCAGAGSSTGSARSARGRTMQLGGGTALRARCRAATRRATRELLREHDVGLALMYTPHPSLVPIEMAAAGMLTVTNTFETKTADALAAISPNLVAAEPTLESVVAALRAGGRRGRTTPSGACAAARCAGAATGASHSTIS